MEEKKNKLDRILKTVLVACCGVMLGLLLAIGLLLVGLGQMEENAPIDDDDTPKESEKKDEDAEKAPEFPELTLLEVTEQGDTVLVSTTYGQFEYPVAFCDLLVIREDNDSSCAQLDFFALIGEREAKLFTVFFGKEEGAPVGTLKLADWEEELSVTAVFYDDTEGMDENSQFTYYAVKETFNDIVQSLEKNAGFTPAK